MGRRSDISFSPLFIKNTRGCAHWDCCILSRFRLNCAFLASRIRFKHLMVMHLVQSVKRWTPCGESTRPGCKGSEGCSRTPQTAECGVCGVCSRRGVGGMTSHSWVRLTAPVASPNCQRRSLCAVTYADNHCDSLTKHERTSCLSVHLGWL